MTLHGTGMPPNVTVTSLCAGDACALVPALAALLIDCVGNGASVSFMAPLSPEVAVAFWNGVAAGVAAGDRVLLVAREDGGSLLGTVQVILSQPENQPHRADVAKLLVATAARRRGVGVALMRAADAAARDEGKTLLVLDTASEEAERVYQRCGWVRVGRIPGYALLPDGRPCDTTYYYKILDG